MLKHTFHVVAFIVFIGSNLQGQILESERIGNAPKTGTFASPGGAYYNFSSGTGCDFKVSVWGHVLNPGRYYIPCETNLLELLSFCGGPRRGAELNRVKVIRRGGLDKEEELNRVFVINLNDYTEVTETAKAALELRLKPGDLVVVDGVEPPVYDEVLRWAQLIIAAGSIISSTIYILNYAQNR